VRLIIVFVTLILCCLTLGFSSYVAFLSAGINRVRHCPSWLLIFTKVRRMCNQHPVAWPDLRPDGNSLTCHSSGLPCIRSWSDELCSFVCLKSYRVSQRCRRPVKLGLFVHCALTYYPVVYRLSCADVVKPVAWTMWLCLLCTLLNCLFNWIYATMQFADAVPVALCSSLAVIRVV